MFNNYLKIALRTMLRNKSYSIINILGLSIGVACCLLLALYIQDERSYDQHHQRLSTIYRITTHFHTENGLDDLATTSPPIAMAMQEEVPEVEVAARLLNPPGVSQNLIRYGDNTFYETDGFLADSTLFDILTFNFIEGNPKKALAEANAVVITDKIAKKLFGNESAMNKVINISQGAHSGDFKISGVIRDDYKSYVHPNFIISMTSSGWAEYLRSDEASGEWAGQNFVPSYVRLSPLHNKEEVVKKMNEVLQKYGAEDLKAMGFKKTLGLEPMKDIYLKSTIGQSSRIAYLYVIASIAVFILLIACINFMNLSTAKATKRAKEVGLRKVMGAFRSSLIRQFMGEALVIVLISILISVVIVQAALPFFNQLTNKTISFNSGNILYSAFALLTITLVTGITAGSYPALYLSSFQPAQVLKGKLAVGNASGWLRRSLVVFQFMIAIVLVCGMIIITQQLNFLQEKNLGFDSHAKIIIPLRTEAAQKHYEVLKKELSNNTFVQNISAADYMPGSYIWSDMSFYTAGGNMDKAIITRRNNVEAGYMELLGIKLIAGRSFTENREMESKGKLIVNRTSAKKLGFEPDQIVGQPLYFDWQGKQYTFEVIGVMEDYHQTTLKEEINPTLFQVPETNAHYEFMIASVNATDLKLTIASIEKIWKSTVNDTPFEYSFLDVNIQKQYDEDRRVSKIITSFTIIAMFISCLGLYGLSLFMAERRVKEIGVRKVMGASINQIVGLMSTEFIKLILIAFAIAVPVAWYGMTQWLQGFAYKTSISIMVFAYAGGVALLIALLTVGFESVKAAMSNPVDSLRSE